MRQRLRTSQSLLGVPALLLIQALLVVRWRLGLLDGTALAWFLGLSLGGCVVFYALVRTSLGERVSREPSLSAPQMVFAMVCVAWGYALAGSARAAMLCLMPLILCFGIFALQPRAAKMLSFFGIGLMAVVMAWLVLMHPATHAPLQEGANWAFVCASMAMIRVLSDRLGRIRKRLSAQKAELEQALQRIQTLATRDTLTGLLNRRAAQDELRRAVGQARRTGRPLTVALADLDHFKQVNDGFGHQAGDRVLQAFAQAAGHALRASDSVARWGGEEFLFVLPDTDEAQACNSLNRLRLTYAGLAIDGLPSDHAHSFSAGVALCTGPDDIDGAIERADRAMYDAKLAGRGRTQRLHAQPAAVC